LVVDNGIPRIYSWGVCQAKTINRKANFSYGVEDAPDIFRRANLIGKFGLQFMKYPFKQMGVLIEIA